MLVMLMLQPPTELQPLHVVVLDFVSGLPHCTASHRIESHRIALRVITDEY